MDSIRMTPAMIEYLVSLNQQAMVINRQIEQFLAYTRVELKVPDDWVFTGQVDGEAFVPPEGKERDDNHGKDDGPNA